MLVHSIVALAFLGPALVGWEVSHLNGDDRDNRPENLCYETSKQNHARREEHGTILRGEAHVFAKLTEAQALKSTR